MICSYLPDRQSSTLFADPEQAMDMATYSELLHYGFRRSGKMVYTPRCENCRECVSVRVPVDDFVRDDCIGVSCRPMPTSRCASTPPHSTHEHYELYRRYTDARHDDGDMADASTADYLGFLCAPWSGPGFSSFTSAADWSR